MSDLYPSTEDELARSNAVKAIYALACGTGRKLPVVNMDQGIAHKKLAG
jgi:hypothetical protein